MLSSGLRNAIVTAGTWTVAAVAVIAALLHLGPLTAELDALSAAATAPSSEDRKGTSEGRSRGRVVELRAGRNGHFVATAEINGRPIEVLVDTGASMVALASEDARRAGINPAPSDYTQKVATANGIARFAPVRLERVSLGDITLRNIDAAVAEPGRLTTSLLGMTFLGRLSRTEMRAGQLVLEE